jgi:hypothetical protein
MDLQQKRWTCSKTTLLADLKNELANLKSILAAVFRFKIKQNRMKNSRQALFLGLKAFFSVLFHGF